MVSSLGVMLHRMPKVRTAHQILQNAHVEKPWYRLCDR